MSQAKLNSTVTVATAEFINPLIVTTAPSDTLHRCADVFDYIGETASNELTPDALSGLHNITLVAAAALRFEAERVMYQRKGAERRG